jgi:outer membrane protein insertion porin family
MLATAPVFGGNNVNYYKVSFKVQHYFPLAQDLTLMMQSEAAYGNGYAGTSTLPFWENYFAGGPQNMRGYYPSSLGPKTLNNSSGTGGGLSLGGSSKLTGTVELQFPVPFMTDNKSMKLATFMDVGNVYCGVFKVAGPQYENSNQNCYAQTQGDFLRYSPGIAGRWISPFGALGVSISKPLNTVPGDRTQIFQFSFGQQF